MSAEIKSEFVVVFVNLKNLAFCKMLAGDNTQWQWVVIQ